MAQVLTDPLAQRQAIFDLRAAGVSFRDIAQQLGISLGKVQRELKKRAPRGEATAADLSESNGSAAGVAGAGAAGRDGWAELDPEIAERERAIRRRRLGLQESALELQALEQQQRLDVLRRAASSSGGNDQALLLLMREIDSLRADVRSGTAAAASSGGLPQARSLIDQLGELQKLGSTIASFAPPSAPSGPMDLDYKIALRKIDLEDQRLLRRDDAELKIRTAEAASVQMRNEALAKFVEQFGPTIGAIVTKWFEDRQAKDQPAASTGATPALPAAEVVQGQCPQCAENLTMSAGGAEKCPACGFMVVVSGGAIVAAATDPNGNGGAPRPRVVKAAETFAS